MVFLEARLLDAKIIFQGQGNLDPTLRNGLILVLVVVLVVVVVIVVVGRVVGVVVELLDVLESSASTSIEHLSGHGPDSIDACKLPQDLVLFVFEKSSYSVFNDQREKLVLKENVLVSLISPLLRYSPTYMGRQMMPQS